MHAGDLLYNLLMILPAIMAMIAATFYATTNHIDKYLISKGVKNADFRSLLVVSTVIAGAIMSVIYLFVCSFSICFDWNSFLILFANSIIVTIAYVLYFKALAREDTTIVAIMFQLIPVFMLFLSPLFLPDQSISTLQLIGGAVATFAAILVTFEPSKKRFNKDKLIVLGMMTLVSIAYAIWFTLQRYVTLDHDFNQTMFWTSVSQFVVGVLIYLFLPSFRKAFHKMLRTNGKKIISLNLVNELLSSFGNIISTAAGMLTSVALVSFVSQSFQPFAVMGIGILITLFFPKIGREVTSKGEIIKRIIAAIICIAGLALINFG